MRTNIRTGLIALAIAAPLALAATVLSNAPAHSGQSLLSPGFLLAQSDKTEEDGMMGQGGMGGMMDQGEMGQGGMDGMMDQGEMGQGGMGGMMNMMQQMSRMMKACNEMMEAHAQHEREPGNTIEPEGEQE